MENEKFNLDTFYKDRRKKKASLSEIASQYNEMKTINWKEVARDIAGVMEPSLYHLDPSIQDQVCDTLGDREQEVAQPAEEDFEGEDVREWDAWEGNVSIVSSTPNRSKIQSVVENDELSQFAAKVQNSQMKESQRKSQEQLQSGETQIEEENSQSFALVNSQSHRNTTLRTTVINSQSQTQRSTHNSRLDNIGPFQATVDDFNYSDGDVEAFLGQKVMLNKSIREGGDRPGFKGFTEDERNALPNYAPEILEVMQAHDPLEELQDLHHQNPA